MGTGTIVTNLLKSMEQSSSAGMFARDTLGCLGAKLAVSRSNDEAKEITFAELSESAFFYFSAPAIAKATSGLFADKYKAGKVLMNKQVKNIKNTAEGRLKNVKLAKFGQIASTFALVLPAVYAIAPLRNILTYARNGKDEFVSVIGLNQSEQKEQKEKAEEKAKKLIKTIAAVAIGGLAATFGFLKAAKNPKVYEKARPLIDAAVKHLDFTKERDLTLAHYGALIYPVSIASYFAASRDKYEKQENARRFSVTVPLMFFGEKLIEKPIHKTFDKIFNTKVMENGKIKSYNEILKLPKKMQKQYLKSKNLSYGLTFATNTMFIAAAVGILNRISTKKNYERENQCLTQTTNTLT